MEAQIQPAAAQPLAKQSAVAQPRSAWRRFFNLLVDDTVLYLLGSCSGFILGVILGVTGLVTESQDAYVPGFILGLAVTFAYYVAFEGLLQRTPGKFITGTRVVTADGGKPTFSAIAVRTLSRFVPFEVISMYTGKEADKKGTWWHDRWTGTRVVRA